MKAQKTNIVAGTVFGGGSGVSTGPISLTRERDTADPRAPTKPNFTKV